MNPNDAYAFLAKRLGVEPELISLLPEITLDQTILNPILPESVLRLGKLLDLRPGQRVLDLACGKGGVSLPFVYTYKVKLIGVDMMPDYIREAWSRAEYSGVYEHCEFINGDAAEFAAANKDQWNAVLILGALSCIWPDPDEGLAAARRLVCPGGHLVIGSAYRLSEGEYTPEEPFESREATENRLKKIGEIVDVIDDGLPGWDAYWTPQKKSIDRFREKNPDNQILIAFLDGWVRQHEWERANIGFGVWVIRVSD